MTLYLKVNTALSRPGLIAPDNKLAWQGAKKYQKKNRTAPATVGFFSVSSARNAPFEFHARPSRSLAHSWKSVPSPWGTTTNYFNSPQIMPSNQYRVMTANDSSGRVWPYAMRIMIEEVPRPIARPVLLFVAGASRESGSSTVNEARFEMSLLV